MAFPNPTFLTLPATPGEGALSVRRDSSQPHTLNMRFPPIQGRTDINNFSDKSLKIF